MQGGPTLAFNVVHDSITTPASLIRQPLLVSVAWTHNYAARLQGRSGGTVTVNWDDHRNNRFGYSGGSYVPLEENARYGRLEEISGILGCPECVWRATREDGLHL